jgi:cell shape-determining protein MreC
MAAYVSVLFRAEMPESGRMLFDAIAQAYQNRLAVFSQVPEEELSYYTQSIRLEVEGYKNLLEEYQQMEPNLDSVSAANEAFRKATSPYVAD